jgi:hypothetical protein
VEALNEYDGAFHHLISRFHCHLHAIVDHPNPSSFRLSPPPTRAAPSQDHAA